MQVLSVIEASEAVLEEKQWQQFAASGSCTLSTNEKPRSIAHKCSRPISYRTEIKGGGGGGRGGGGLRGSGGWRRTLEPAPCPALRGVGRHRGRRG